MKKNKLFIMGTLAMALAFGVMVIGCEHGPGPDEPFSFPPNTSESPTAGSLVGLWEGTGTAAGIQAYFQINGEEGTLEVYDGENRYELVYTYTQGGGEDNFTVTMGEDDYTGKAVVNVEAKTLTISEMSEEAAHMNGTWNWK